MSDLAGPLGDMLSKIGRAATAERWAAEIVGTRTPATILINIAFRTTAIAMSRPDTDTDGDLIRGMESILSVLIIAYTDLTDVATVAAIMDHIMTYWEQREQDKS